MTRNYARFFNAKAIDFRFYHQYRATLRPRATFRPVTDIQNWFQFELQWPDNMTIMNKLQYIDSYYLASMHNGKVGVPHKKLGSNEL